jgi:RNA polymerase sigma-70 factor (ECF subfamily)
MSVLGALPVAQKPECELVGAAQAGDLAAFEELAGAHTDHLYSVVLRLLGDRGDAEDVMQETLLRAWRGIGRFRADASFFTWLYRIAQNESNRALERRLRRVATVGIDEEPVQVAAPAHHEPAIRAEHRALGEALKLAIASLDSPYRTALVLRDLEGLSTREAAKISGVGEAAFKSRLHHARFMVRASLGDAALTGAAGLCGPR